MKFRVILCVTLLCVFVAPPTFAADSVDRVTILFDAFGKSPKLKMDWGYSALVEYGGKRILFDTGNDAEILEQNVKALGVDLTKLDFVVISHRHADHTSGLSYVLRLNPDVKIYTPVEVFGLFGGSVPKTFYRAKESLSADMRYYRGTPPDTLKAGSPWPSARFVQVDRLTEVVPGVFLIPTVSQVPGTLELHELSLAIRTPNGLLLVDGCSHAGIEKILEGATAVDPHLHLLFGGLHLVKAPDEEVERIATALRSKWKLDRIAPGHCTGEPAFAALQKTFDKDYLYAGVGTVINLR